MNKRVLVAGLVGNMLELYDFVLFAYFAAILAPLFFPGDDALLSLIKTYGVFASGFVMRPLGAVLLGYVGDRWGRKRALEISIAMMLLPTLLTGLLPTYANIGIYAPLLLMLLRMCQGFSVGGELVGSYSYLGEHASPDSQGFATSWTLVGTFAGKLLGVLVFLVCSLVMSEAQLQAWGWRIPFLLGLLFGLAGLLLRRKLPESPVFEAQKDQSPQRSPLREALSTQRKAMLQAFSLTCVHTVAVYLLFSYMPVYLRTQCGQSYNVAMCTTLAALLLVVLLLPVFGSLSDRLGRLPLLGWGALGLGLLAIPCFSTLQQASISALFATQLILAFVFTLMHAPLPALYLELFPAHIRNTAAGIAYNSSVMLFGSLTPLLSTWLIREYGDSLAPAYVLLASALLSLLAVLSLGRRQEQPESLLAAC